VSLNLADIEHRCHTANTAAATSILFDDCKLEQILHNRKTGSILVMGTHDARSLTCGGCQPVLEYERQKSPKICKTFVITRTLSCKTHLKEMALHTGLSAL
jgi:hypothetical protein